MNRDFILFGILRGACEFDGPARAATRVINVRRSFGFISFHRSFIDWRVFTQCDPSPGGIPIVIAAIFGHPVGRLGMRVPCSH